MKKVLLSFLSVALLTSCGNNKSQQDAFLPPVEDGTLYFIGATTENPSFALNNALLSRARISVLNPLTHNDLRKVIYTTLQDAT